MTSKSAPLGWSTKNSPIGTVSSSTTLEMLRSWVIITKFEGSRCFRISCTTKFLIQFGLVFRYYARWLQILNGRCATKREPAGVNATAIGAGQNLPNRNAVSAEGFSDALGLLYTAGGKIYFCRTVSGREPPYPFSDIDVSVTQ